MRFFLVSTLSLFLLTSMVAQDLVVTRGGDSINCKIDRITGEQVFYSFRDESGIQLSSVIPRDQVASYDQRYYTRKLKDIRNETDLYTLSLDLKGGYSRWLAEIHQDLGFISYQEEMLNGWNMGIDASLFFGYNSGISFKYNRFFTSNSMESALLRSTGGQPYFGEMADNIAITYIGPAYAFRTVSADRKQVFTSRLGFGSLRYYNHGKLGEEISIYGNSWGASLDAGYHNNLTENVGIGIKASFIGGILTEYEVEFGGRTQTIELDEEDYWSLSSLDLSLQLVLLF